MASAPTYVVADAIDDQADTQGLALHPVTLFVYKLQRKAGIIRDAGYLSAPLGLTPVPSPLLDCFKHPFGK